MIKELTPLQALEKIGNAETKDTSFGTEIKTNLSNEYRIIEKSLKALEIIKNKKVNVRAFLKSCSYKDIDTQLKVYNAQCCDWQEMESKELTQKEYELLKEMLK